jgi:hypothetical protein
MCHENEKNLTVLVRVSSVLSDVLHNSMCCVKFLLVHYVYELDCYQSSCVWFDGALIKIGREGEARH